MVIGKLRRAGNSLVVTIPADEVARLGLREGQQVAIDVRPVEIRPALRPELRAQLPELLAEHGPALDYLKDR
jgi:antitoxin component of MazEF toxin-antitoxin module